MNAGPHRSLLLIRWFRFFTPFWKKNKCKMTVTYSTHYTVSWYPSRETFCHKKCEAWKGCCVAPSFSPGLFCCVAMDSEVVYLGVWFGTGRGEALRLFDCFIMVIYTAIYLCILCYVCHYMYTIECLFVCVHVLVCVCV